MTTFPASGIRYTEKNVEGILVAEAPSSISAKVRGKCSIGFMSYTGPGTLYDTDIGRFCSIAGDFTSGPTNHPTDRFSSHLFAFDNKGVFKGCEEFEAWVRGPRLAQANPRVKIGNDVWIGKGVTVMRGITIGDGAIIGAGSVVTKDVAAYTIVGGIPAKPIRMRFSDDIIARLENLQWHQYRLDRISVPELDVTDIVKTLDVLELAVAEKTVERLAPIQYRISGAEMVVL